MIGGEAAWREWARIPEGHVKAQALRQKWFYVVESYLEDSTELAPVPTRWAISPRDMIQIANRAARQGYAPYVRCVRLP